MKKAFIAAFLSLPLFCTATPAESIVRTDAAAVSCATATAEVVFRSTQKLKSCDGRRIYLYSNGQCELFDGDRLAVECTYAIRGNEVRLLDENGRTVYSGTFRYKSERRNLSSISLAGTTYYSF